MSNKMESTSPSGKPNLGEYCLDRSLTLLEEAAVLAVNQSDVDQVLTVAGAFIELRAIIEGDTDANRVGFVHHGGDEDE